MEEKLMDAQKTLKSQEKMAHISRKSQNFSNENEILILLPEKMDHVIVEWGVKQMENDNNM